MHRHRHWPIHLILSFISALMLVPFVWVLKTSLTGENIFAYPPSILPKNPHLFYYVDVWYSIPFFQYLVNSVFVSAIVVIANIALNALAGYALSREFFGKKAIIMLFLSCMMIVRMSLTASGSMPAKGSSNKIKDGSVAREREISKRRRSPPDSTLAF